MRLLSAFRDRDFRLARLTRVLALAAALGFALLPALAPPAMAGLAGAAPPGLMAICTSEGVAYVPVDPAIPADADHATRCLHYCCVADTTALGSEPPIWTAPCRWTIARESAVAIIAPAKPADRPPPRGPPAA